MQRLCAIVLLIGLVASKKLPSYLEPCPRSVKEAGPCILKNVKIIQPKMEKGIPEMLIPALNPLDITESRLDTKTIKAAFTNAKLYNLHNFELVELKFNIETLDVYISINFPLMWSTSSYSLQGKILLFEFDSHGIAQGNFTNLWADFKGKMELYDKDGKKHFKINKVDMNLEVKGASLYFGDIFPNNKELTENANKVLNENSKDVIKDFLPVLIETVKSIVLGIANRIFEKYSFDDLFPDVFNMADGTFLLCLSGQIEWADVLASSGSSWHCKYEFCAGPDWRILGGLEAGLSQIVNIVNNGDKVILNLPIEIQYKSTNPYGWPQIVLSVYKEMQLAGYGRCHVPLKPGNHKVEVSLSKPQASSMLGYLASFFGYQPELLQPKMLATTAGNNLILMESSGTAQISFNIVTQGFNALGYDVGVVRD